MTMALLRYLQFQRDLALAQAELLAEQIRQVEEEANAHAAPPDALDPRWKSGARLTSFGRQALFRCFDDGMRQSEVARLFRISMTRAHTLHKEWHAERATTEPVEARIAAE